jgi:hypothetical protein
MVDPPMSGMSCSIIHATTGPVMLLSMYSIIQAKKSQIQVV